MNDLPKPSDDELEEAEEYFRELITPPGLRNRITIIPDDPDDWTQEIKDRWEANMRSEILRHIEKMRNKKDSTS